MRSRAVVGVVLLALASCKSAPSGSPSSESGGAAPAPSHADTASAIDRTFDLAVGKSIALPGSADRVTFVRVVSDNRCPKQVNCIRAGEAIVELQGQAAGGETETVTMTLSAAASQATATLSGYAVQLLRVAPYPQADVAVDPADYVVQLRVTRP